MCRCWSCGCDCVPSHRASLPQTTASHSSLAFILLLPGPLSSSYYRSLFLSLPPPSHPHSLSPSPSPFSHSLSALSPSMSAPSLSAIFSYKVVMYTFQRHLGLAPVPCPPLRSPIPSSWGKRTHLYDLLRCLSSVLTILTSDNSSRHTLRHTL